MGDFAFFITTMPDARPADYYIGCLGGSVFMDFDNYGNERIRLVRISFDGYGCCHLNDQAIPLNEADSRDFKELIGTQLTDQTRLTVIIKKAVAGNRNIIWEDALNEYGLL